MFVSPNKLAIRRAANSMGKQDEEKSKESLKKENLKYFEIPLEEKNEIINMGGGLIDIEEVRSKYTTIHSRFGLDTNGENNEHKGVFNLEVLKKNELVQSKLSEVQIENLTLLKKKKTLKNKEIIRNLIRDN